MGERAPSESSPSGAGPARAAPAAPGAPAFPLEPSAAEMERLGRLALDRVVAHLAALPDMPSRGDVDCEDLCRALAGSDAPERGASLESLLDPLFDEWIPRSFTTPGPGYLAYIPGGGIWSAALADFIACATNRYTGVWQAAPALIQLEANVLRWFAEWMGMPATTRGLLTTGGSQANATAIVCAREKLLGERLRDGVLYTSGQAHLCVRKSARLVGVLPDRVRLVPVDARRRMRVDALAEAVAADRAAGLRPFLVASSAGTTNTGAVDPLDDVADLCAREGLWHHVDGAYGAFFHMVPELRPLLAGLSRADSIALDPHKGLFLPYGTGALLVRDGRALHAAHAETAEYLPTPPDGEAFYDPSQYGPELSRDFRGLRLWLPLHLHGVEAFRDALREKRALAVDAARRLAELPGIVLDDDPQLSLFPFHVTWPGATLEAENAATTALVEGVTRRGRVMITGCTVDGRFLARICVLCFRTHEDRVDACVEDVAAEAAAAVARA